jgi:hypothetical protein
VGEGGAADVMAASIGNHGAVTVFVYHEFLTARNDASTADAPCRMILVSGGSSVRKKVYRKYKKMDADARKSGVIERRLAIQLMRSRRLCAVSDQFAVGPHVSSSSSPACPEI